MDTTTAAAGGSTAPGGGGGRAVGGVVRGGRCCGRSRSVNPSRRKLASLISLPRSVHHEAAVDAEGLAGHVVRPRPGEEGDYVRHVFRLLHAPEGYLGRALAGELLRSHAKELA